MGLYNKELLCLCLIYWRIPKEKIYKCSWASKCITIICLCNSYLHTFTVIPLWTSGALNPIIFRLSTTHLKDKRESTLILILSLLFLTSHIMKILSSLQLKNLQAMTIKNVLLLCFISLFHFKDVIPKELQSHLVYKFTCGNCNLTYYGKTKRHLNARSSEHKCISHFINIVATIVWIATHSHITSFQVLQKVQTSICYNPNAYH